MIKDVRHDNEKSDKIRFFSNVVTKQMIKIFFLQSRETMKDILQQCGNEKS
jgi:hypothetical protein